MLLKLKLLTAPERGSPKKPTVGRSVAVVAVVKRSLLKLRAILWFIPAIPKGTGYQKRCKQLA